MFFFSCYLYLGPLWYIQKHCIHATQSEGMCQQMLQLRVWGLSAKYLRMSSCVCMCVCESESEWMPNQLYPLSLKSNSRGTFLYATLKLIWFTFTIGCAVKEAQLATAIKDQSKAFILDYLSLSCLSRDRNRTVWLNLCIKGAHCSWGRDAGRKEKGLPLGLFIRHILNAPATRAW